MIVRNGIQCVYHDFNNYCEDRLLNSTYNIFRILNNETSFDAHIMIEITMQVSSLFVSDQIAEIKEIINAEISHDINAEFNHSVIEL